MPISSRTLASIIGVLMVIGSATAARAEKYNCFKHPPQPGCCFKITMPGNTIQNNGFNPCATCNDTTTNPYASCPAHSCSASYDSTTNTTTMTFCPGANCTPTSNSPNGTLHFGLDGGGGGTIPVSSTSWDCSTTSTPAASSTPSATTSSTRSAGSASATGTLGTSFDVVCAVAKTAQAAASSKPLASKRKESNPSLRSVRMTPVMQESPDTNTNLVSVTTTQAAGTNPSFLVVYVRGTQQQAQTTDATEGAGLWAEQPFPTGQTPDFQLVNNTDSPIWLNDVGTFSSTTEIAIGLLNFTDTPPTGQPNSPFSALTCLDGVVLAAHGQTGDSVHLSCPLRADHSNPSDPAGTESASGRR